MSVMPPPKRLIRLESNPMPDALFTTSFALLQGVMDATLARSGRLPGQLVIATFGDHELRLIFLVSGTVRGAASPRYCGRVLELVLATSLDEKQKPAAGITRIRRDLCRRGSLSRR